MEKTMTYAGMQCHRLHHPSSHPTLTHSLPPSLCLSACLSVDKTITPRTVHASSHTCVAYENMIWPAIHLLLCLTLCAGRPTDRPVAHSLSAKGVLATGGAPQRPRVAPHTLRHRHALRLQPTHLVFGALVPPPPLLPARLAQAPLVAGEECDDGSGLAAGDAAAGGESLLYAVGGLLLVEEGRLLSGGLFGELSQVGLGGGDLVHEGGDGCGGGGDEGGEPVGRQPFVRFALQDVSLVLEVPQLHLQRGALRLQIRYAPIQLVDFVGGPLGRLSHLLIGRRTAEQTRDYLICRWWCR
mmetsp:Transcript_23294/g.66755  ORF Transcript_23294/g.66755 Transcript_23294/m.66755 type:complete len:298 (+) Transcript_23294:618-1511(+)